jgi:SM-20-related protein
MERGSGKGLDLQEFTLKLRDDHDVEAYKKAYAEDGIVRIERLFPDSVAEIIHQILARQTPWRVVHSDEHGKHKYYAPPEWNRFTEAQRQSIIQTVLKQAQSSFAYIYTCYPMVSAYLKGEDPDWPLHIMMEFLNSDEMLNFTKAITNEPSVIKLDGQATLYAPGHFLNVHNDTGDHKERRAAYVMGFTKNWRVDWGGQLLFLDGDNTECGFSPSFNTLTLFKVPRNHIVTQVTNFAGAGRYSITGWLRDDPK